jgi:tryptophan synthase beta subunit
VVVCLSGRGDKDLDTVMAYRGTPPPEDPPT